MSRECTICNHVRRLEIDRRIVEGKNMARIAREFDVPEHSIYQHKHKHLSRQLVKVMETKGFLEGDKLMEIIDEIVIKAKDILDRNYKNGHDIIALKAIDSIKGTIQLLSNISAQLHAERLSEAQLAMDNGEDKQAQEEQKYFESLSVYSTEELKVYQRLLNKRLHKNSDIIVLNDKVLKPNYDGNKSD